MRRFTIKKEHLKLLRRAYTSWDHCEFGAPEIDPKRPYGNSDVIGDMAEILGIEPVKDEDDGYGEERFRKVDVETMQRLHLELETVLEIILRTGKFKAGDYVCRDYSSDWELVPTKTVKKKNK